MTLKMLAPLLLLLSCSQPFFLDRAAEARDTLLFEAALADFTPRSGTLGRFAVEAPPCGPGVRPYIWTGGRPALGQAFSIAWDPYGLPSSSGLSSGLYDWPPTWIVIAFAKAQKSYVMPGGCELPLEIEPPGGFVWRFEGDSGFRDPLLWRLAGSRTVALSLNVPPLGELAGRTAWTVAVQRRGGIYVTSQVLRVTFGV